MIETNKDLRTQEDRLEFWFHAQATTAKVRGRGIVPHEDDVALWKAHQIVYPGTEPRYKKCGSCTSRRLRELDGWAKRVTPEMETLIEKKFGEEKFEVFKAEVEKGKTWGKVFSELEAKAADAAKFSEALDAFAEEWEIDLEDLKARVKKGETLKQIRADLEGKAKAESEARKREAEHTNKTEETFEHEGGEAFKDGVFLKDNPYTDEAAIAWSRGWQKAKTEVKEQGAAAFKAGSARETGYENGARKAWFAGYDAEAVLAEKAKEPEATNKGTGKNAGKKAGKADSKEPSKEEATNEETSEGANEGPAEEGKAE